MRMFIINGISFLCIHIFLPAILTTTKASEQSKPDRQVFSPCVPYASEIIRNGSRIPKRMIIPDERKVAQDRHLFGVQPTLYDLRLTFDNITHYRGSVNITFYVINDTRQLMLNVDIHSVSFNSSAITISTDRRPDTVRPICIEYSAYLEPEKLFIVSLNESWTSGDVWTLSFPSLWSSVYNEREETGARGLRLFRNAGDDQQQTLAISTVFKMREARTVFPCADYPVLKARFRLCITHNVEFVAYSNTQSSTPVITSRPGFVETCFPQTPPLPSYLFGFALLKGYEKTYSAHTRKLALVAPASTKHKFEWIFEPALAAFEFLVNTTGFQPPFEEIKLLIIYQYLYSGLETAGLITMDGDLMEYDNRNRESWRNVFMQISHHWIGNVATVTHWREVCLQEGLAMYFAWQFEDSVLGKPMTEKVRHLARFYETSSYPSLTDVCYKTADDIELLCHDMPPIFFYTIDAVFGSRSIGAYLSTLISAYKFDNAGINDWDRLMNNAIDSRSNMTSFLKIWFSSPGPLAIIVRTNGTHVRVAQNLTGSVHQNSRPLGVQIYTQSAPNAHVLTFNTTSTTIPVSNNIGRWLLVDPDGTTATIKVYDRHLYMQMFSEGADDRHGDLSARKMYLAEDFCTALAENRLPLPDDFLPDDWRSIFRSVYKIGPSCKCCLVNFSEEAGLCRIFKKHCMGMNLVKMLE